MSIKPPSASFVNLLRNKKLTSIPFRQAPSSTTRTPDNRIGSIAITGRPDSRYISTSYIERKNLTMRMGMRRFTRLTNGFSKRIENHGHALAPHYMHYNFCRVHQTLRITPAMEAGIADHVWSIEEVVSLLDRVSDKKAA